MGRFSCRGKLVIATSAVMWILGTEFRSPASTLTQGAFSPSPFVFLFICLILLFPLCGYAIAHVEMTEDNLQESVSFLLVSRDCTEAVGLHSNGLYLPRHLCCLVFCGVFTLFGAESLGSQAGLKLNAHYITEIDFDLLSPPHNEVLGCQVCIMASFRLCLLRQGLTMQP